jgi:hypothetical protein
MQGLKVLSQHTLRQIHVRSPTKCDTENHVSKHESGLERTALALDASQTDYPP